MNILLIVLVFGVIVFFHELGHFLAAKLNKVAVAEFSIGLGPAIFSKERKGTKYSLRLLPLGGYCMMLGEDAASDDENAFNNKSVFVRMMIMAAGPLFNFVLAFLLGIYLIHYAGCDPAVLYKIEPNSAAEEAGISDGDEIIKINDISIDPENRVVKRGEKEIDLTPREFDLLLLLARNKNITLYRDTIYEKVWNMEYTGDTRTLDLHIRRLRNKVDFGDKLKTIYGVGYRLEDNKE